MPMILGVTAFCLAFGTLYICAEILRRVRAQHDDLAEAHARIDTLVMDLTAFQKKEVANRKILVALEQKSQAKSRTAGDKNKKFIPSQTPDRKKHVA